VVITTKSAVANTAQPSLSAASIVIVVTVPALPNPATGQVPSAKKVR
jgi:hypothetical protein